MSLIRPKSVIDAETCWNLSKRLWWANKQKEEKRSNHCMKHWVGSMRTSAARKKGKEKLKMLCLGQWVKNYKKKRNVSTFALLTSSSRSSSRTKWKDLSQTITLLNQPTIKSVAALMFAIPRNSSPGFLTEKNIMDSCSKESLKSNIFLRICVRIERLLKPNSILLSK